MVSYQLQPTVRLRHRSEQSAPYTTQFPSPTQTHFLTNNNLNLLSCSLNLSNNINIHRRLQQQFNGQQRQQQQFPNEQGVLMNINEQIKSVLISAIDKALKHAAGLNEATFINNATSTLDMLHTSTTVKLYVW